MNKIYIEPEGKSELGRTLLPDPVRDYRAPASARAVFESVTGGVTDMLRVAKLSSLGKMLVGA